VPAPSPQELKRLVQRIAERIGRSLERSGLITRDIENAYLAFDPAEEAPINGLLGASTTYRIATQASAATPRPTRGPEGIYFANAAGGA
jgi:hypothetical protein